METNVSDERVRFVRDCASGQWSMTELCERYGVSRPTATNGWRVGRASPTVATPRITVRSDERRPGGAHRRSAP